MDFKDFYKELIFDIDKPMLKRFTAKQGDTKSRGFYVPVMQNGAIVDVVDESMTFYAQKPDGTRVFQNAVKEGGLFRVDLKNQVFAVDGVVRCELTLYGTGGKKITNKTFTIEVEPSLSDNSIVSEDERGVIDDALEFAEEYVPRLELIDIDSLEHYDSELKQNKVKISTVEKELSDYKRTIAGINVNQEAKQEASGYGIVSLPKNAANGQISGVMRGETLTNLADNGENNSNWVVNGSSIIVESGIKIIGGNASNNVVLPVNAKPATVYTLIYTVREVTTDSQFILSNASLTGKAILALPKTIGRHSVSLVSADTITYNQIRLQDNESTLGTYIIIDDVMLLEGDYTDRNIPYINDTKSTIGSARVKSVGKNLFDKKMIPVAYSPSIKDIELSETDTGIRLKTNTTGSFRAISYRLQLAPNTQYCIKRTLKINSGSLPGSAGRIWVSNIPNSVPFDKFDSKQIFTTGEDGEVKLTFYATHVTSENADIEFNDLIISRNDTPYEPHIEDRAYITAKKDNKIVNLRSLPNGTKDEISLADGNMVKSVSDDVVLDGSYGWTNLQNDTTNGLYRVQLNSWVTNNNAIPNSDTHVIKNEIHDYLAVRYIQLTNLNKYQVAFHADGNLYLSFDKGYIDTNFEGTINGIKNYLNQYPITLTYQLAEPEIIPVQVSGSVVSHPNGTVYIDPATTVAGVYAGGIPVTHTDLPIGTLERITVIDYATGLETELDVSQAVISEDKLLFTHPDLSDGDIVFFEYEYDVETTQGEATIQYYDSRYTIKDSVTGKFYKWNVTVADGVPSIELVEV